MAAMVLSAVVALGVSAPRAATVAARQADDDCMDNPLGPVPAYSVVTHGDFEEMNTESDGRMVVGGNARLTNFGVATKLPVDPTRVDLAVGGNLTIELVRHQQRQRHLRRDDLAGRVHGPERDGDQSGAAVRRRRAVRRARDPLDLVGRARRRAARSRYDGYALRLTGTDRDPQRLQPHRARSSSARRALYLRVPDGATTLINIRGGSFVNTLRGRDLPLGRRHGLRAGRQPGPERRSRGPAARDLWNFPDASSVDARPARDGAGRAACSRPRARVNLTYQHIFGSIAADVRVRHGRDRRQPAEPVPARPDAVPDAVADAHADDRRRRRRAPRPATTPTPTRRSRRSRPRRRSSPTPSRRRSRRPRRP